MRWETLEMINLCLPSSGGPSLFRPTSPSCTSLVHLSPDSLRSPLFPRLLLPFNAACLHLFTLPSRSWLSLFYGGGSFKDPLAADKLE